MLLPSLVLAIDTTKETGAIALGRWNGEAVTVIDQSELPPKTFAAQLVPAIRRLLQQQHAAPRDLHAIVVVSGPGSFTGIRIGVSAAKGFAEALAIPVIALSRLALLAKKANTAAAAIDAGRSEFYFGSYAPEPETEKLLTAVAMREHAPRLIAISEPRLADLLPNVKQVPPPDAAEALIAAAPRLKAEHYEDLATLDGNYVRRTVAELFGRPDPQK